MSILSIDPGPIKSAYVVIEDDLKPIVFGKIDNQDLLDSICFGDFTKCTDIAIEMIASYGMAVGKEVFETCLWIGKFSEALRNNSNAEIKYIYRKDEKMHICGSMKAKDSNIRQALIDRFAKHDFKNGKGTKSNPDWFYGFKSDIWAAYAVAVTYAETGGVKQCE